MGTGLRLSIFSRKLRRCSWVGTGVHFGMKSPGTVRGLPYTNSAGEAFKSSLGIVLRPNNTHGSSSTQFGPVSLALREALRVRCSLSTNPLACGW